MATSSEGDRDRDLTLMLRGENDRLRQLQREMQLVHDGQLGALVEQKERVEARCAELQGRAERSEARVTRLERELADALTRREQQAEAMKDVRRQVDARLTKLMEELLRKDEELHRLEYAVRTRDKDRERAAMLEKMLAAREENVEKLGEEVHRLQMAVNDEALRRSRAEAELAVAKEREERRGASLPPPPPSPEQRRAALSPVEQSVAAILPLYRQWISDTEREVVALEATVDAMDFELADLRDVLEAGAPRGGPAGQGQGGAMSHDRRRLLEARRMERERVAKQHQSLMDAAAANNDSLALNVQAIRCGCDNFKFVFDKVAATAASMLEALRTARGHAERHCTGGGLAHLASAAGTGPAMASPFRSPSATTPPAWPQHPSAASDQGRTAQQLQLRINELESQARSAADEAARKEGEVARLQGELATSERAIKAAEQELASLRADAERRGVGEQRLREEIVTLRREHHRELDEQRRELDAALAARRADQRAHAEELRRVELAAEERLRGEREAAARASQELRASLDETSRRLASEQEVLERMRTVLEDSKRKRLALKQQRDELQREAEEVRATLAAQAKELHRAREVAEALEVEVEQVKAALAFEAQAHEEQLLGGAAALQDWKMHQQQQRDRHVPRSAHGRPVFMAAQAAPRAGSQRR